MDVNRRGTLAARVWVLTCFLAVCLAEFARCDAPDDTTSGKTSATDPAWDAQKGVWQFRISSPQQQGANDVEVLLPDDYDRNRRYRSLYILPVETGIGGRYGDGLQVVKSIDAHNRHQLVCIAPAFDLLPWYMDHASNSQRQHETYIKKSLVPVIENRYSIAASPDGRLLLGFSKSGWGAFTLLLRHPDFFGYAASWDAPLMLAEGDWHNWGISGAAGTVENFRLYQPSALLQSRAGLFRSGPRFVLLGHKSFGPNGGAHYRGNHTHTVWAHDRMTSLGVRHVYDNDIRVPHEWRREWVETAIRHLAAISRGEGEPTVAEEE
jgi:hypothetical protein